MKRILVMAAAIVMVLGISSAFGANSLQSGSMGISVGMGDSVFGKAMPRDVPTNPVATISGRYLVQKDLAVTAGFGFQSDGSDQDASFFSIGAGVRKYLKTDDFAPFVNGKFTYAKAKDNVAGLDAKAYDFEASFGAEYFFAKGFSLEGAIGFGFGTATVNGADDTYFGTRTVGVFANFYF